MKVLWFSNNIIRTGKPDSGTSTWGWVDSLASAIRENRPDCELYIAFRHLKKDIETFTENGIHIIRVPFKRNILEKAIALIRPIDRSDLYLGIVDTVNPDIVQIFGSESDYGLLCGKTDVPIVIHVQGILAAYKCVIDTLKPRRAGLFIRAPLKWLLYIYNSRVFNLNVKREKKILSINKNFMVRTFWDKSMIEFLADSPICFCCNEVVKKTFREAEWHIQHGACIRLVSVIGNTIYKGINIINLAASILKEKGVAFEWNVIGVTDNDVSTLIWGLNTKKLSANNVTLKGKLSEDAIVQVCVSSDIFIHPSYIENSSNAIMEAMCLGMPIIAAAGGGTTSLLEHEITGYLFTPGDYLMLASEILRVSTLDIVALELVSSRARKSALAMSDPKQITDNLIDIYRKLVREAL
jgi:glycosyltransferase involved in cell wall biosynthesis